MGHSVNYAGLASSHTLSAAAFVLCLAGSSAFAQTTGLIEIHRQQKLEIREGSDQAQWPRLLSEAGLDQNNADAESLAVYTNYELSADELAHLAGLGISWTDVWIPPVANKHPHGFHLGRVPFSAMNELQDHPAVVRIASTEIQAFPQASMPNDLAAEAMDLDDVVQGYCNVPGTGAGVKIAVADSGFDLSHPDFPTPVETYDVTDGGTLATWGTNVANTLIDHGTGVAGAIMGSGLSSGGQYAGAAPDADMYLYKIGSDMTGDTKDSYIIQAIDRASSVGCSIMNLSYGGLDIYMDGSSAVSQAVDAAFVNGMVTFCSTGSLGNFFSHADVITTPGNPGQVAFTVDKSNFSGPLGDLQFTVNWKDITPGDSDIQLVCTSLLPGEALNYFPVPTSPRGTDCDIYLLNANVASLTTRTFTFELQDVAVGAPVSTLVHIYQTGAGTSFTNTSVTSFTPSSNSFFVSDPAQADSAVAVSSWTHRLGWNDSAGNPWFWPDLTLGTLEPGVGAGPRIDGLGKPDLAAPGATVITTTDSMFPPDPIYLVDDDGVFGVGGAHYQAARGSSFASPWAAGVAALLLEADPSLTPVELVAALKDTASQAAAPDALLGHGLINIVDALQSIGSDNCPPLVSDIPTISVATGGTQHLSLNFGDAFAGQFYWLLGSASGTGPGLTINGQTLPLTAPDPYFDLSVARLNQAPFLNSFGILDAEGRAKIDIVLPATFLPGLAGLVLNHASLAADVTGAGVVVTATTAAESLTLVP
ncbi:MAG: subtilisin family serine protease [Planctomycetota bacterium]|jgi:subtilisin family serine protease